MKNKILATLSLILVMAGTSACSAIQMPWANSSSSSTVDTATRLAAGTLMLEGTDMAVDATSAAELLPLWKAVRSLGSSDVASTVEVQSLYAQIEETLTADQMQAIDAMSLDQDTLNSLMQQFEVQANNLLVASIVDGSTSADTKQGAGGPPADMVLAGGQEMGGTPPEMGGAAPVAAEGTAAGSTAAASTISTSVFVPPLIDLLATRAAA